MFFNPRDPGGFSGAGTAPKYGGGVAANLSSGGSTQFGAPGAVNSQPTGGFGRLNQAVSAPAPAAAAPGGWGQARQAMQAPAAQPMAGGIRTAMQAAGPPQMASRRGFGGFRG